MKIKQEWLNTFHHALNHFQKIPENDFNKLAATLTATSLAKNSHLVLPGEAKAKIGFVVKGILRSYVIKSDGTEFNTDFCKEGYLTGSYEIFLGKSQTSQPIQAIENCIILMLDYDIFERDFLNKNTIWQSLLRKLVQELYIYKSQREEELLLLDAAGKYQKFLETYGDVKDRIPQYHIASYLGITPVALSRVRKNMGL